jgi:hypothetical protein
MKHNTHDKLSSLHLDQLANVVGGAWPSPSADGGGNGIIPPWSGSTLVKLNQAGPAGVAKCGAPKATGNPGRPAFHEVSPQGVTAGGVQFGVPSAVCSRVPQFGHGI